MKFCSFYVWGACCGYIYVMVLVLWQCIGIQSVDVMLHYVCIPRRRCTSKLIEYKDKGALHHLGDDHSHMIDVIQIIHCVEAIAEKSTMVTLETCTLYFTFTQYEL